MDSTGALLHVRALLHAGPLAPPAQPLPSRSRRDVLRPLLGFGSAARRRAPGARHAVRSTATEWPVAVLGTARRCTAAGLAASRRRAPDTRGAYHRRLGPSPCAVLHAPSTRGRSGSWFVASLPGLGRALRASARTPSGGAPDALASAAARRGPERRRAPPRREGPFGSRLGERQLCVAFCPT